MDGKAAILAFVIPMGSWFQPTYTAASQEPPKTGTIEREAVTQRGLKDPAELEAFLDGLMAGHLKDHEIAGAVVSVVKDGELFFAKGYGYADVESRTPVDPARTLFLVGSVTKLFTWTLVMQAVEEGLIDLDTDVNEYIDFEIPATFPDPITVTHLLTHTPGLEDWGLGLFSKTDLSRGEWLAANLPTRVGPAGRFSAYSNYGATLAGYIVERAFGNSWEALVDERILEPLGMEHSSAWVPQPERLQPDVSAGYVFSGGRFEAQASEVIGGMAPAGSVSATATDMARFMLAHLQLGRLGDAAILQEATARKMQTRIFGHDPRISGFAHGFYETLGHGLRVIGHGGDTMWFHSVLALIPEEGIGVFASYNSQRGAEVSFGPFLEAFLDHYYPVEPVTAIEPSPDFVERMQPFLGTYRLNRGSQTTFEKVLGLAGSVTVGLADEGVLTVASFFGTSHLVEVEPGLFHEVAGGSARVAFRQDGQGRVTHLFLNALPMMAAEKLAWHQAAAFHFTVLGTSVFLFLTVLIGAPVAAVARRRYGVSETHPSGAVWARRTALGVSTLNLAFLVGLAVVFGDFIALARGEPTPLGPVLLLAVLGALLTPGVVLFAVLAWRRGHWGFWSRLHYTAFATTAVAFVWFLNYWNLLGWRY